MTSTSMMGDRGVEGLTHFFMRRPLAARKVPEWYHRRAMNLQETAEEKLGKTRAEELHSEIKQLSEEIEKLRSVVLDIDDEP